MKRAQLPCLPGGWALSRSPDLTELSVFICGSRTLVTHVKNERGDITIDSMNIKEKERNTMLTNLITWMKWAGSLKDTIFQNSYKKK